MKEITMLSTEQPIAAAASGATPATEPITDFAPRIENMFSIRPLERSYLIEDIVGRIPDFIVGRYYLNGPALFSRPNFQYRHWLDGDGMVYALRFGEGSVHFTNRFIRTTKFNAEQGAGRPLFRTFGTAFPGDLLKRGIALESPVNVSVYPFRGTLLAFGEQGVPWELDPNTLVTMGQFTFGGALSEISPFGAHPKFDRVSGEMFNFGIFFSDGGAKLRFYCFDRDGRLKWRRTQELPYPCSIHDFNLSTNYAVFYLSPYILDINQMVQGHSSLMDSLHWEAWRGSQLLIISRHSGKQVASIPLGKRYCLHTINCFEQEENLFVDVIELDRPLYDQYQPLPDLFTDVPQGCPIRLVVSLRKSELIARQEVEYPFAPDFPAIDPRRSAQSYLDWWMLGLSATGRRGRKFFDQLVHARWDESKPRDVFCAAPGHYLGGEPVFVEDPDSNDAAVLCQEFDADLSQSAFLIFDAFDIAAGPVAALYLKEPVHLAFHASFRRDYGNPINDLPPNFASS
jgi:all-trans-8'-apo-beta-carotenal 15,15'-oxygenase